MIQTILVALDGSPRAPGVLRSAAEIARRFDSFVVAARVIFVPPEFPPAAHVARKDALPAHMVEDAERELRVLLSKEEGIRYGAPLVQSGAQPWRTIVELSEELDVDLVVIGSHGYHGVDRILGTTAGKVANVSRRNVLVVHERADIVTRSGGPTP